MKRIVFTFLLALSFVGISQVSSASLMQHAQLGNEITHAEKAMVCCELDARKVLSFESAVAMLRSGDLTITKVNTGVYRVQTVGGMLIDILIDDQ